MGGFGDFQETVGKTSGSIQSITSKIMAVIFFIIAIVISIAAVVPTSEGSSKFTCTEDKTCPHDETCVDGKCQTKKTKKTRKLWLLIVAAVLILIGIAVWWYGNWYNKWVHQNRSNAQVGAAFTEFSLLADMLHKN